MKFRIIEDTADIDIEESHRKSVDSQTLPQPDNPRHLSDDKDLQPSPGVSFDTHTSATLSVDAYPDQSSPGESAQSWDRGTKRKSYAIDKGDGYGHSNLNQPRKRLKYSPCQNSAQTCDRGVKRKQFATDNNVNEMTCPRKRLRYSEPGCSKDNDVRECPSSCLCKEGQPLKIKPKHRFPYKRPASTPLRVKLLQYRATGTPNIMVHQCCEGYCSHKWPRRSNYEFHREFDPSDLRVYHFSWGTWKEEEGSR